MTIKTADYLKGYGADVSTLVDVARGLYWHCADYHEGPSSERYSILSTLDYSPGMAERGPEPDTLSADVYDALAGGELDPKDVLDWIEEFYAELQAGEN